MKTERGQEIQEDKGISRRSFLTGAAVVGAGLAGTGLAGCTSPNGGASKITEEATDQVVTHNPSEIIECDVVVVGSGTAGMCAATRAAELGAKVVCLEKESGLGGTSAVAEGLCGIGSKFQAQLGIEVDPKRVFNRAMDYHHWAASGAVTHTFINECGKTIDWLMDNGIVFATVEALGISEKVWHLPLGAEGPTNIGIGVLQPLTAIAKEKGVEFHLSTPATELIIENGVVTGVYAKPADGDEIQINASVVLLASGGYANNAEMFEEYTGRKHDIFHVWGMPGRDGDGIAMGLSANAATHFPGTVMFHSGRLGETTAFSEMPNFIMAFQPNLRVNETAERYFNEAIAADFSAVANTLISQAANYTIIDDDYLTLMDTVACFNPMPNLGAFPGQPCPGARTGIEESEYVIKADTIEALADKLGLDPVALTATVERYNELCEAGNDEDYYKDPMYLQPVKTAPFYGAKIQPTLFTTVGGLRVNGDMAVVDSSGVPIPGLYAAGGDAAGLYGANYDVNVASGSQQGWAATSGRLAMEHALQS
ncbi:MAG: FAD-dependent oxidoreductase [Actinobacteria bacterium]|nr:FAD-dependent oxidoreductase [Actinomycetota bacterium]